MINKLKLYAQLVKFEHTIFAIPFVFASIFIVQKGIPPLEKIFWILIAAIAGRTAGMAFNRFFDLPFDKLNPRTKNWVSVTGAVKAGEILGLAVLSSAVLIFSAYKLNKLAFYLSPVAIFLLIIYPLGKRFTNFVHLILGAVYFIIPIAVSVALKGEIDLATVFLGLGMAFWVAGFDIFYALQDIEFDRKVGVHSIPAKFGIKKAITFARVFHFLTFIFLVLTGYFAQLGIIYYTGLVLLTGFLIYEHTLIKENDLSKINVAFFTVNGYISILYMIVVLLDIFVKF
ncbi:4-hydroxybenzoate polyprenyltransferase [Persephonella hydrogeniphila]|uniref:4-hydroxybenzoate polyprenyltransferase n=1 Tax=Persephonella hydrogeniphila TaxID=198703 RepID=A0A285N310_9AQUI|nr:UbiA-like polyprenyltransferase [Persephonella hydrogeniphila]SNZ03820.1 4-hydroxybenzoate polyprenyltransferase [Persephonella hydrogeniphila]